MKKTIQILLILSCIGLFWLPTFAQKKGTLTAAQKLEQAQRAKDEKDVAAMPDFGFDGAVVTKDTQIRETAETKGKLLLAVKRGEILTLVVREAQNNWYNVVEEKTGTEGWINGKFVIVKLTENTENTGPSLNEVGKTEENADPVVSITNQEEKTTLRIRLNGKLYLIPPKTTKEVTMPAGKFKYYGWSPGIRPATGSSNLEKGKKYSWVFRIYRR